MTTNTVLTMCDVQ